MRPQPVSQVKRDEKFDRFVGRVEGRRLDSQYWAALGHFQKGRVLA